MMIDEAVAYCQPFHGVSCPEGRRNASKESRWYSTSKGEGFKQPLKLHERWHTVIPYVKIEHRFYFFICVLDGYSRFIVHWDLWENMKENDVAIVQKVALEKIPGVHQRYITDNWRQFTGN